MAILYCPKCGAPDLDCECEAWTPPMTMQFTQQPDPLAKLPALAQRLGVPPLEGKHSDLIVLRTRDGQRYDLFALLNALLDRLERPPG